MMLPSLLLLSPSLLLLSLHLWPSLTSSRRAPLAFEHISPSHTLVSGLEDTWCITWQNGSVQSHDGKQTIILGDLVLSSKLVVYDMENQTIGWTEYNCSSSIKIKDEKSGAVYSVGAHNISLAFSLTTRRFLTYLSVLFAMLQTCYAANMLPYLDFNLHCLHGRAISNHRQITVQCLWLVKFTTI
ncbi:hypothetical protein Dsin_021970 [Dipteronia sinensis]|uniref:Peptidase A1 domain-containing protein n=1 Tax=Dipteronia sinensis TaxID=43782 RepID=A0AAE0A0N0_9ROSI|nr:hypothetical protein Dsin_021970 [Dipteronia sinensis]